MHFSSLCYCLAYHFFQLAEGKALPDTYLRSQFLDARLRTHPDDVVDVHVIAEEDVFAGFDVQHACISRMRLSEEIKE